MPSFIVRFPDGSKEFRYPDHDLDEDEVIAHAGDRYRVASVDAAGDKRPGATVELDTEASPDPSSRTV